MAFGPTITGDLPPNSRVSGTKFDAASDATFLATFVDPVKSRWSNGNPAKSCEVWGPPFIITTSSYY